MLARTENFTYGFRYFIFRPQHCESSGQSRCAVRESVRELTCYPRESGKRLVYLYVSTWYLSCWQIPRGCGTDIVRLE